MGNGKPSRITRHAKAAIQWLDYLASKPLLWVRAARPGTGPVDAKPNRTAPRIKPRRNRLTVPERIRFKRWLWWKYGPECGYCHTPGDWRYALTIDHIQPMSKGGAVRDVRNMVLACRGCNQAKGNTWEG